MIFPIFSFKIPNMDIEEIKKYMKSNKITYERLSELSKIPIGTLRDIFRGATKNPRIDTMDAIEEALGLKEQPKRSTSQIINDLQKVGLSPEAYEKMTPDERQKLLEIIKVIVSRK